MSPCSSTQRDGSLAAVAVRSGWTSGLLTPPAVAAGRNDMRRINRMPSNCEEKCKERFTCATNDKNETNHFADCCLSIVVALCSEAGAASEKSAHARRCKENRSRGGDRS